MPFCQLYSVCKSFVCIYFIQRSIKGYETAWAVVVVFVFISFSWMNTIFVNVFGTIEYVLIMLPSARQQTKCVHVAIVCTPLIFTQWIFNIHLSLKPNYNKCQLTFTIFMFIVNKKERKNRIKSTSKTVSIGFKTPRIRQYYYNRMFSFWICLYLWWFIATVIFIQASMCSLW